MFRHAGMTVRRVTGQCELTREPSRIVRDHSVPADRGTRPATEPALTSHLIVVDLAVEPPPNLEPSRQWRGYGRNLGLAAAPSRTGPALGGPPCWKVKVLLTERTKLAGGDCTTSNSRCRDVQCKPAPPATENRCPSMGKWYPGEGTAGQEPTDRNCSEAVVAHSMRGSGYKPIQNTTRVQTTRTAPMPIGILTGSASVSRSPKYITRTTLT